MDYISTEEAAREAGVSSTTVRRWIRTGALEGHQVGGRWLVDAGDLEDLLATEELDANDDEPNAD